jgi:hypothetical protein
VDSLVERVVMVEGLSKQGETSEVSAAYDLLAPQLEALRLEVIAHLDNHAQG